MRGRIRCDSIMRHFTHLCVLICTVAMIGCQGAWMVVQVRDADTQEPLAGVPVLTTTHDKATDGRFTDAEGRADLWIWPRGRRDLMIVLPDRTLLLDSVGFRRDSGWRLLRDSRPAVDRENAYEVQIHWRDQFERSEQLQEVR